MKNNKLFGMIRTIFGKTLVTAVFLGILSVATFAQSQYAAFFNKSNNNQEGYIGVYGDTLRINWSSPGLITVIGQPCTEFSDKTWLCTAITYRNGQPEYKGEYQIYKSGVDFGMRHTHRWNVNHWETEYNDGWTFYYVK